MQKEYLLRICSNCDNPLRLTSSLQSGAYQEGIIHGDEYYCSAECWNSDNAEHYEAEWEEFYDKLVDEYGEDQDEAYYTEWELEEA